MAPIPPFNSDNVLPPFLISPTSSDQVSPYPVSIIEVCHRFATSKERIEILRKFISFRELMFKAGITFGFQWLDGSFVENIEVLAKRPPSDLDLVTFYAGSFKDPQLNTLVNVNDLIARNFPLFGSRKNAKDNFQLDHFVIDITDSPIDTVDFTRWIVQLFTHSKRDKWKGILRIPLNTPVEDLNALDYINKIQI